MCLESLAPEVRRGCLDFRSMKKIAITAVVMGVLLIACKDDDNQIHPEQTFPIIELSTDFGKMYLRLYDDTPIHKANFDSLTRAGFYDSTEFHRCVDDFVIQGGSPTSKDDNRNNDGGGSPGYTLPAEIDTLLHKHQFGSLAAARIGNMTNPEKRSSGSQFYIVTDSAGASFLDNEYTVFGEVLQGMDVAKTIENQPKNSNNLPDERIKMFVKYVYLTQEQLDEKGIVLE